MATYSYGNGGNNSNSPSEKTRIYQYWGSNIVLDEISVEADSNPSKNNKIDVMSVEVPLIRINDTLLSANELMSLYIDCSGFLPRIEVRAIFGFERFMLLNQIKDGDILSVVIRSQSDDLKIIRNDYIITNAMVSDRYTISNEDSNITPYIITFSGELFIPKLYLSELDLSYLGTSYESIQNVAKQLDLGFASNETSTNDRQVWLSYNTTPKEYLENMISKVWKDENSFFDIWVDLFYNLTFVNVNSQLTATEDELDYGVILTNIDKNFLFGGKTEKKDSVSFPKILSNMRMMEGTSSYIKSWHTENKSSYITSMVGTTMYCNLYEHNNKVYNSEGNLYWSLPIEPTYDKEKLNSHIILRGRCTYNPEINKGQLARSNYKATEIFKKQKWVGIQYTCTNTNDDTSKWDGNQHVNYNRAIVHNNMNLYELDKLNTYVNTIGTNMNIIRGDKFPIILQNMSNELPNIEKNETQYNNIDRFHSGWYYVKGVNISWNTNDESPSSRYTQTIILTRREWPTPEDVEPIKN